MIATDSARLFLNFATEPIFLHDVLVVNRFSYQNACGCLALHTQMGVKAIRSYETQVSSSAQKLGGLQ